MMISTNISHKLKNLCSPRPSLTSKLFTTFVICLLIVTVFWNPAWLTATLAACWYRPCRGLIPTAWLLIYLLTYRFDLPCCDLANDEERFCFAWQKHLTDHTHLPTLPTRTPYPSLEKPSQRTWNYQKRAVKPQVHSYWINHSYPIETRNNMVQRNK